ncbi:hypothetical protein BC829DRAFT_280181 [Chytridium lagenaria]|nr:hypothetical protein BC829DRAFT_280181 [Chytridium lagenaria]
MEPFNVTGLERDYGVGLADENAFPGATFRLKFQRSPLTKFIVIFSWLLMHLWTFMIIFMTLQVVFRDRDPMQFMFWTAASIFSMGTIRGLQPAAPAIGTVGDVVTYIWGIVISSIMAFVLFCVAFRKHKPKSAWDKEFNKKDKASKWRAVLKDEAEVEKKEEGGREPTLSSIEMIPITPPTHPRTRFLCFLFFTCKRTECHIGS